MTESSTLFVEVYETHVRSVHAYCRRRVSPDRVDDAVAETFLAVWRKIDRVPPVGDALPWLYGVANRVVMHEWRGSFRRRRLDGKLAALGVDFALPPEEHIVTSEESHQVLKALSALRPVDQEVLRLSLWEELAHAEIAAVLEIRADAVRQRLSRALRNLTKEFNKLQSKQAHSALFGKEVGSGH